MNDPRDEHRDDRVLRREQGDWRMTRRDEIDRYAPCGRARYHDDEDDDEPYRRSDPRKKANGPGLAMVIVGCVWLLFSLATIGAIPFLFGLPPGGQPEDLEATILAAVCAATGILSAVGNALAILGGVRMRRCRNWGLALTAAILLLLLNGVVGGFVGVWALVVLLNADVKREFDRVARSGGRGTDGW